MGVLDSLLDSVTSVCSELNGKVEVREDIHCFVEKGSVSSEERERERGDILSLASSSGSLEIITKRRKKGGELRSRMNSRRPNVPIQGQKAAEEGRFFRPVTDEEMNFKETEGYQRDINVKLSTC
uniref:Uncharacterized protein n=1 Tax=Ditylum brightwellii TaxID=49249 RepID=A0A6U3UAU3_9STRA|mmetsp:Transcript_35390/g.52826  ORF Transcript_35390/g.52826 Transcript_35390/m.52826 type:complete len:125 (-) Transcript_35390:154-528(-)